MSLPSIKPGKRAIISGRTGSGKSTLACWLLNRSKQHWLIFNPKHTGAYKDLPDSVTISGFRQREIEKSLEKNRFTIINFSAIESEPQFLDACILHFHEAYENIGICVDELYTVHNNGRAGSGLVSWLTRGREMKQSFLGLTQRPAWISKFCYSESDYICGMDLSLDEDRKTMRANSGCGAFLDRIEPRHWVWYDVAADKTARYGQVPAPVANL